MNSQEENLLKILKVWQISTLGDTCHPTLQKVRKNKMSMSFQENDHKNNRKGYMRNENIQPMWIPRRNIISILASLTASSMYSKMVALRMFDLK